MWYQPGSSSSTENLPQLFQQILAVSAKKRWELLCKVHRLLHPWSRGCLKSLRSTLSAPECNTQDQHSLHLVCVLYISSLTGARSLVSEILAFTVFSLEWVKASRRLPKGRLLELIPQGEWHVLLAGSSTGRKQFFNVLNQKCLGLTLSICIWSLLWGRECTKWCELLAKKEDWLFLCGLCQSLKKGMRSRLQNKLRKAGIW